MLDPSYKIVSVGEYFFILNENHIMQMQNVLTLSMVSNLKIDNCIYFIKEYTI